MPTEQRMKYQLQYQSSVRLEAAVRSPRPDFGSASRNLIFGLLSAVWQDMAITCRSFKATGYGALAEVSDSLHLLTRQMLETWQR